MNDAKTMRVLENIANLRRNLNRARRGETTLTRKQLRERFTFDKFHHYEVSSVRQVSGVEDHCRVRMMQLRHCACFAQKTICDVSVACEFALDDLDCYGTFQSEVGGEVNSSHAAGPDFSFNPESASDELRDIHIDLPCRIKRPETTPLWLGLGEEVT